MAYRDLMHELDLSKVDPITGAKAWTEDEMISILPSASHSEADFFEIKSTLTNYINQINNNTNTVHEYTDKYMISTTKDEYENVTKKIDMVISNNSSLSSSIRKIINSERPKILKTESSVTSLQVIEFNNTVTNFQSALNEFQQALNNFDSQVSEKQMRQIRFLRGSIDESEMKKCEDMDYEQRQGWIEKQFQLTDDRTLQRLIDLEEQRDGMMKIERNIKELRTLFEELQILVIDQQALIDAVAENVEQAMDDVKKGRNNLEKGEDNMKKARKMKCWCVLCVLIILVVAMLALFGDKIFGGS